MYPQCSNQTGQYLIKCFRSMTMRPSSSSQRFWLVCYCGIKTIKILLFRIKISPKNMYNVPHRIWHYLSVLITYIVEAHNLKIIKDSIAFYLPPPPPTEKMGNFFSMITLYKIYWDTCTCI